MAARTNSGAVKPGQMVRWLAVKNTSGEEIPAFAAMKVDSWDLTGDYAEVDKPDEDDATCDILFNGPTPIPISGYGAGTCDFPARARCDGFSTGTCGVLAASWELSSAHAGFYAHGGADADSESAMVSKCL